LRPGFSAADIFKRRRLGSEPFACGGRGSRLGSPAMKVALVDDVRGAFFFSAAGAGGAFFFSIVGADGASTNSLDVAVASLVTTGSDSRRSVTTGSGGGGGSVAAVALEEGRGQ